MEGRVTDALLREIASLSLDEFEALASAIDSVNRRVNDMAWENSRKTFELECEGAWEAVTADDLAAAISRAGGR